MSTGDHIPSSPASNRVGCNPLVMHTFMHSPHFTHLFRNSLSSGEPGGLMSLGWENPDFERGIDLIKGTAITPDSTEVTTLLLPRSIPAATFSRENPKLTAFWG